MLRTLSVFAVTALVAGSSLAQSTTPTPAAPPSREKAKNTTRTTQAPAATPATGSMTIVETAVAAGNFKTLASLLAAAGLVDALKGPGPFTVMAPTDEAFAKLPPELMAELAKPENKERLAAILKFHVVPAKAMAADVVKMPFATTLQGQRFDIVVAKDGKVMVDQATVTKTDIVCSNGVIHVIDTVIVPMEGDIVQVATGAGTFNILLSAIGAAGMTDLFKGPGPFTVLAPTDDAFRKLPKGTLEDLLKPENKAKLAKILGAHVVPGTAAYSDTVAKMKEVPTIGGSPLKVVVKDGKVMIGGATVVKADVEAKNGVIHAIDTVIIPADGTTTAGAAETKNGN
jgi:transforming growth factor-beta-induced protein